MEYTNKLIDISRKKDGVDKETLGSLITLLAPFVPHIAEELWHMLGHETSVFTQGWPEYDEEKMKEDEVEMPVQINGKVRATITIAVGEGKDSVLDKARTAIESKLDGKNIVKEIYVPNKIINIVVK